MSSWKTTDTEDTSVNGGEILLIENEAGNGNNWISLTTIKTWLATFFAPVLGADDNYVTDAEKTAIGTISGKLDKSGGAMTGAMELGVASTTTGLLNFYNSGTAYPTGIYSPGATSPSIGIRLPGTMPTGNSFMTADTSGYLGWTLQSAFQPADAQLDTWATVTPSANGQSLVSAANYAAMRTLLDLEPGVDYDSATPSTLALTTDTSVTEAQLLANKYISNYGASGEVDITLPAVSYNISRTVIVEAAQIVELNPPSGELFDLSGTLLDANDVVDSPTGIGAAVVVTRVRTGASTWRWSLDVVRGTWTDSGASD